MKRVFAIAISLLGGGITAYNSTLSLQIRVITPEALWSHPVLLLRLVLRYCVNMVERQFN